MNKKSLTKNKKKTFKRVAHIYKDGEGLAKWNDASSDAFKNATSAENLGSTIGAVGSALGSFVTAGMDNAKLDTTEADNAIESVESYQPDKSSLDALTKSYDNLDFGRTNYEGSEFTVSTGEGLANMGKAALSGASAGATIGGPWGAVAGAAAGLISAGSGWIAGAVKAKSKADELNRKAEMAGYKANSKFLSAKDTIAENDTNTLYQGMKSYGGDLNLSGNFDNGLIFVNEGGTHEQNPYDGVLMGVDNQGIPNLVEEGEIIWNDYVFSNRLKPTKKLLTDMGFDEKYADYTFAKMVEKYQEESSETAGDWISNNTFTEMMNRIMTLQEAVRAKKGLNGENRMMALGGRKYDGKQNIWNTLGQMAPIADNLGKLIYNAAKPVDESNIIAEKAYRDIPMMTLPEIGGKISYRKTDRNNMINPILNAGRSTINDIKNNAVTGSNAIAGILGANYNTQKAVGDAYVKADAADLNNALQVGNFNFGIDRANLEATRAEQLANISRGEKIAAARVADANQREAFGALKGQSIDKTSAALAEGVGDLSRQNIQWNWIKNNPANADAVKVMGYAKGGKLTSKKHYEEFNKRMYPKYGNRQNAQFAYDAGARDPEAAGSKLVDRTGLPTTVSSHTTSLLSNINGESKRLFDSKSILDHGNFYDTIEMHVNDDNELTHSSFAMPNGDRIHLRNENGDINEYYERDYGNALGMNKIQKPKSLKKGGKLLTKTKRRK